MKKTQDQEALLHYTIAFTGGYLGIYAILSRCGIFGSAQTSNLLTILQDILGHRPGDFFTRLGALAMYVFAIVLATWLPEHTSLSLKRISIFTDACTVALMGLLPAEMDPVIALYPIFFATAFQWCSFPGAYGYVASTIFSTNNLRQFTAALTRYQMHHEESALQKARFFGFTLLAFHCGAAASYGFWELFGISAVWLCLLPLAGALAVLNRQELAPACSSET